MKKIFYILPHTFNNIIFFLFFLINPELKEKPNVRHAYYYKDGYGLNNYIADMENIKEETGYFGGAYFPLVFLPNIVPIIILILIWVNS